MAERIGFTTKTGLVEEAIREAILRGEIAPGEWLRAEEWANRLGVSPTPVREALGKLEALGLVKVFPHRGAQVARFDLADFVEVYRIRAELEGLATRLAVEASDEDALGALLGSLEQIYLRMEQTERDQDVAAMRCTNYEFHMTLYAAAASPRLEAMIRNLWATFPWDTLSLVNDRSRAAYLEHREMVAAVRQRDGRRAGGLMTQHIEAAARSLIQHASSAGFSNWSSTSAAPSGAGSGAPRS